MVVGLRCTKQCPACCRFLSRRYTVSFSGGQFARLNIDGNYHGCNTLAGNFEVREISYGPNNEVRSFWAAFEQHCEGIAPALLGEIRYSANAPNSVTLITSSQNPSLFGEAVTLTATVGGVGSTPSGTVTFREGETVLGQGSFLVFLRKRRLLSHR